MPKFEPFPDDSEVLDSILDYPVEPGTADDDHEDTADLKAPLRRRLTAAAKNLVRRGE